MHFLIYEKSKITKFEAILIYSLLLNLSFPYQIILGVSYSY